mmetsp:Transcript_12071/g.27985  ORF Transcript_12071/g.27985 Transcript_12071/m.27985 type:complete len:542 (-) Transcript_12071:193-1818(-)
MMRVGGSVAGAALVLEYSTPHSPMGLSRPCARLWLAPGCNYRPHRVVGVCATASSSLCGLDLHDSDCIDSLVKARCSHRAAQEFAAADAIKEQLELSGVRLEDLADGSTRWNFAPTVPGAPPPPVVRELTDALAAGPAEVSGLTARVLRMCTSSGARPLLLGRSAGDMMFEFALAGSDDTALFDALAAQQAREFARWRKPQPLTTLQVCERAVAAGLPTTHALFEVAAASLGNDTTRGPAARVRSLSYGDERPLRWLFRRAARMAKAAPPTVAQSACALSAVRFDRPMRPLLLDLGCGFGTSLLSVISRADCNINVLGCDASAQKAAYACGVAERWGRRGEADFVVADALAVLRWARSRYPGPVGGVCIQFPTPFRVDGSGNAQLPGASAYMVSAELVAQAAGTVRRGGPSSWLYFASNVEDVAVDARRRLEACGLVAVEETDEGSDGGGGALGLGPLHATWRKATQPPVSVPPSGSGSRRRSRLEAAGLGQARASGAGWLSANPLGGALSETEAALQLEGRPIFRLLLRDSRAYGCVGPG